MDNTSWSVSTAQVKHSLRPMAMSRFRSVAWAGVLLILFSTFAVRSMWARDRKHEQFGVVFSNEITAPEADVLQAVEAVVNDGIIEGSKEYNKDLAIEKAAVADSSPLFPQWTEPGKVFYKVREKVLAPVNFKESNDEGTLAVRYVVQPKDATRTILRIDAVFVEDFRHRVHPSNGSVESAEFKSIQDRVDKLEADKKQTEESAKHREEEIAKQTLARKNEDKETLDLARAETSVQTLQQHVHELRQQVQRIIKAPGAQLKSAPFHTASSLKPLDAGAEVVILVVTPYWYGVETEDGQHGWLQREQLEPLP